ncbi:MAG TPA: YncE family protein [Bacteroidales bacterium]|nr:YncE family protein [Bacteroidales bacterium]HPS72418.1 YncE family protein [Bacteroidales bacterium]
MMKRENFIKRVQKNWIIGFSILLLAASCDPQINPPVTQSKTGIYILNEGGFNMNNSSLSFFNFKDRSVISDLFLQTNNRGLGDVANDMKLYGSKLYIVVNNSETIEIINPENAKSIKQISLIGKQPRNITFFEDKAYVSCFDGTVVRIDTTTLLPDGSVSVGLNPEGICVANNKLYVANSGGLSSPITSNTVSVVDLNTYTEIKRIVVATGPRILKSDQYGDVYVACTGNYGTILPSFHRINTVTDEAAENYNLQVHNFTIQGNFAYLYSYNYNDQSKWFKVMDISTENIVKDNFISDATNIAVPYGIAVDPVTNDVYITDAGDFVSTGDVYCFNSNGVLKYQFEVGIIPSGWMVFKR